MGRSTLADQNKASGAHPEGHPLYAPGLKWRARVGGAVPMWYPRERDVKAGYIPKSLTLDPTDSQAEIAAECRKQWQDLEDWRAGKPKAVKLTIDWLIDRYKTDPTSPFHALSPDTQESYGWECKRISETCGTLRVDPKIDGGVMVPRRTGEEFRRLFHGWGHPEGKPPTPSRATHCMAMMRTLLSYNVEIGTKGADQLRAILTAMRFKKSGARTVAPTYAQVDAIVTNALEMGFRSIAIATLAQYELIERRAHIIGQWRGDEWSRGWVWDGHVMIDGKPRRIGVTPDWNITYYQTKKGANLRAFSLVAVQRLLGLMQETPKGQRHGAVIVCETTGQPWEKRRYQEKFREIARAAGVPDEVLSMDMRSGGATEADEIEGVTDRMFDDAGGWADPTMKNRYRRQKQRNAGKVVELRQAARNKQ